MPRGHVRTHRYAEQNLRTSPPTRKLQRAGCKEARQCLTLPCVCAAPRSGLAWKHFIDTGAGVIDADYRGNVGVILFNHAEQDFAVKRGDRVAQLVLERIATPDVEEVCAAPLIT